jgi:hypothetical protein
MSAREKAKGASHPLTPSFHAHKRSCRVSELILFMKQSQTETFSSNSEIKENSSFFRFFFLKTGVIFQLSLRDWQAPKRFQKGKLFQSSIVWELT